VHDRVEGHVAKGGIVGLFIGAIVALCILYFDLGLDDWKHLLILTGLFGMLGGIVAWTLGRVLIPKGVKDQRYRDQHPSVRRKVQEDWKVGPKPPGL
jgi:membrane protein YqaA with SNARE-associated domain